MKKIYRRAIIKFIVFYLLLGTLLYLFRRFSSDYWPLFKDDWREWFAKIRVFLGL